MKKIREFLPHLAIAFSLGLALITVLDGYNPLMAFLTSPASKIYIYCACAASFLTALVCIYEQRRAHKKRRRTVRREETDWRETADGVTTER